MQEVVNCRAFSEELGIGDDGHVGPPEHTLDNARRTDRNRRLVDHHRTRAQYRPDLLGRRLDVREVGAAVVVLRSRDAQEHDIGIGGRLRSTDHEAQPARRHGVGHDRRQPVFDDRDLAGLEPGDLAGIDVGTHDHEAEVGEAGARGEPDIAGSDHSNRRADRCLGGRRGRRSRIGHRRNATNATSRCRVYWPAAQPCRIPPPWATLMPR